jgi:hypothetical protein
MIWGSTSLSLFFNSEFCNEFFWQEILPDSGQTLAALHLFSPYFAQIQQEIKPKNFPFAFGSCSELQWLWLSH